MDAYFCIPLLTYIEDTSLEFQKTTMAKGIRKRRSSGTFFKLKNTVRQKTAYPSSTETSNTPEHRNLEGSNRKYQFRARSKESKHHSGNRIINLELLMAMITTIFNDHKKTACRTLHLELHSEMKLGLGSKLVFKCRTCSYISGPLKTYHEIPGSRSVAMNTILASAIMDTPMGIRRTEELFTQLDIPFPAISYMQKLTNNISSTLVQMGKEDMVEKRRLVQQHRQTTGSHEDNVLDLSIDARYNATRLTSSYKPGQSSSQAYTIAVENHTDKKYIVGVSTENKLCWTGIMMRSKGVDVTCPDGHAGCTANLDYFTPHSERRMAHSVAEDLHRDGYFVRTLTTDGDSKSYLGMQDFYNKLDSAWEVTRQADPNHLAATQERKIRSSNFSAEMFPSRTKAGKKKEQSALARDIRARCSAVIEEMARRGDGDITRQIVDLPNIRKATVECYAGNCSLCHDFALVCSGDGANCWWYKSYILGPSNITYLKMNEHDKALMSMVLQIRLSEAAIFKVSSRTSTQKCEAFNRATLSTMPKSQNYPRTFSARLALQTIRSNNTIKTSVQNKIARLARTTLSSTAVKRLAHLSQRAYKKKNRQLTKAYKMKRIARRAQMEKAHRRAQQNDSAIFQEPDYVKG